MFLDLEQQHILAPQAGTARIDFNSQQAQGLVVAWALNDGAGDVARSCCGRLNGTLKNGPTWGMGKFGRALSFDGVDDYVQGTGALPTDVFSVSLWFRSTSSTYCPLLEYTGPTSARYGIFLNAGGYPSIIHANKFNVATTSWNDGRWHHFVGIWNKIYLDGIQLSVGGDLSGGTETLPNTFRIGRFIPGTYFAAASISDVRIYNRALSASEVRDMYVNPLDVYEKDKIQVFYFPSAEVSYLPRRTLLGVGI